MFEFLLQAESISADNGSIIFKDVSDWTLAADLRASFGVFITGAYRLSSTPNELVISTYDPLTDTSWISPSVTDGRYSFTAYAFYLRGEVVPNEGDVHIYTDGKLYQYISAAWVLVELEDVLADAFYTSEVLEVPLLSHAYAYKNTLNLEYIKRVKHDMQHGAKQNKLYYKRSDLDYVNALIHGAEYNWSMDLYFQFYETVINLNLIISTKQIS